jgi:glucosylglycerate synthase
LCLVLEPSRPNEPSGPDVVVGVPAEPDRMAASEAALALESGLKEAFPGRPALAVVLTGEPNGAATPEAMLAPAEGGRPPAIYTGGHTGPEAALPTLLEIAVARDAPACALLEALPRPRDAGWLRALLEPVLAGGYDLVVPSYARGRLEGVLVTGIVYPLTRALFGKRLRQPLGRELVLSRRLAQHILSETEWRTDPSLAGRDLWCVTKALAREVRIAQVFIGPRPRPAAQPPDVSDALAGVLDILFHEMQLHAHHWQRVRGSEAVATFGEEHLSEEPAAAPPTAPLVDAFTLGWRDLRQIWSRVLPPQTLLALQRIPSTPPEAFRMPDPIWARVLYDFAVGWRFKALDRRQLLRSLTPIYMGWVASYVNEVGPLGPKEADERVERLCAAFEEEKPYLISRWRWPDRFNP